jgi:hypothetical protein
MDISGIRYYTKYCINLSKCFHQGPAGTSRRDGAERIDGFTCLDGYGMNTEGFALLGPASSGFGRRHGD